MKPPILWSVVFIIIIIIIINWKLVYTRWQWYYNTQETQNNTYTHSIHNIQNYKHNNTQLKTRCTKNYKHDVSTLQKT
jgi:archaellum component FlaF (FlaF/FlaG flagellin family)